MGRYLLVKTFHIHTLVIVQYVEVMLHHTVQGASSTYEAYLAPEPRFESYNFYLFVGWSNLDNFSLGEDPTVDLIN